MQFSMRLGCTNNILTLKQKGIDYPDLPCSKVVVCSICRQKIRFYTLLKELPIESPQGVRVNGKVVVSIVGKPVCTSHSNCRLKSKQFLIKVL